MTGQELRRTIMAAMRRKGIDATRRRRMQRKVRFPHRPKLLGDSQKVRKGAKKGVLTAVLYLAAADRSRPYGGADVCPFASPGCRAACLGHTSGRLVFTSSQNAQVWKTLAYLHARDWFLRQLAHEIHLHRHRAGTKGLEAAVRLNGTSDIAWENSGIMARFSDVQFYDYTKSRARAERWARGELPANYHLTFSQSEINGTEAAHVARVGGNVAAVFRTQNPDEFPSRFLDLPVINGDETDVRFGDPRGCVVGLTAKGPEALRDRSGFVQETTEKTTLTGKRT